VRLYCFDLLFLNGQSLLQLPLWKRQGLLRAHFTETDGFAFAKNIPLSPLKPLTANADGTDFDPSIVTNALKDAVEGGAEGLMVKLTGQYGPQSVNTVKCKSDGLIKHNATKDGECGALGHYESGTRSHEWLKVKRDYIQGTGFADTIDVVPIGAWYGNGRKAKAGFLSPILLAVYDEDDGVFCSISRCMSFSDEMYQNMRDFYFYGQEYGLETREVGRVKESPDKKQDWDELADSDGSDVNEESSNGGGDCLAIEEDLEKRNQSEQPDRNDRVNCFPCRPPSNLISTNENPPIWFRPLEVFEVSFADLSISRTHKAAAGLIDDRDGRGVALRFPRFKRKRPDKDPTQATTTRQIAQMFYQQSKIG